MSVISKVFHLYSYKRLKTLDETRVNPWSFQREWFEKILKSGSSTSFGKDHNFSSVSTISQFQKTAPLLDYDKIEPYIDRIRSGEDNVLWNSKIKWFAKSSGTSSSKSKFIPITSESLSTCHYDGMQNMLATYINQNPQSGLLDGMALTLGGSAKKDVAGKGGTQCGDLSAILLKNSPSIAELRRTPPKHIALIGDFEEKVNEICKIAGSVDVTNISGVPSWNLIMLNSVLAYTNKNNINELWPNLELFMHGGINFEPYRSEFKRVIPSDKMNYLENYNASEGYFAFQDNPNDRSMLLMVNNGVFYEFIPLDKLSQALAGNFVEFDTIESVKTGVNYAMIITTNGGLWRYLIGDSVSFTSLMPHKLIITGRTQLFINAFGEELMIGNAERALSATCEAEHCSVENFTVAPLFMEGGSKGSHQWLIEFSNAPASIETFAEILDIELCKQNSDYEAKRTKNSTMVRLSVVNLKTGTFYKWLKEKGKLGGQNKIPRLNSSREIAEDLIRINSEE